MIVKAYQGDGRWQLWSATDLEFLGQPTMIEVPDGDHAYSEDDRFPKGWEYLHHLRTQDPYEEGESGDSEHPGTTRRFRFERWVKWTDPADGERHILVTDGPVYICNDDGQTIEALR